MTGPLKRLRTIVTVVELISVLSINSSQCVGDSSAANSSLTGTLGDRSGASLASVRVNVSAAQNGVRDFRQRLQHRLPSLHRNVQANADTGNAAYGSNAKTDVATRNWCFPVPHWNVEDTMFEWNPSAIDIDCSTSTSCRGDDSNCEAFCSGTIAKCMPPNWAPERKRDSAKAGLLLPPSVVECLFRSFATAGCSPSCLDEEGLVLNCGRIILRPESTPFPETTTDSSESSSSTMAQPHRSKKIEAVIIGGAVCLSSGAVLALVAVQQTSFLTSEGALFANAAGPPGAGPAPGGPATDAVVGGMNVTATGNTAPGAGPITVAGETISVVTTSAVAAGIAAQVLCGKPSDLEFDLTPESLTSIRQEGLFVAAEPNASLTEADAIIQQQRMVKQLQRISGIEDASSIRRFADLELPPNANLFASSDNTAGIGTTSSRGFSSGFETQSQYDGTYKSNWSPDGTSRTSGLIGMTSPTQNKDFCEQARNNPKNQARYRPPEPEL